MNRTGIIRREPLQPAELLRRAGRPGRDLGRVPALRPDLGLERAGRRRDRGRRIALSECHAPRRLATERCRQPQLLQLRSRRLRRATPIETPAGPAPFTVPGPAKQPVELVVWPHDADVPGVHRQCQPWRGETCRSSPRRRRAGASGFRAAIDLRPTAGLRTTFQIARLTLDRQHDDSRFSTETIPRVKVEYQLNRAIFFRVVGQYAARSRSALEDRNGNTILVDGSSDTGVRLERIPDGLALQLPPDSGHAGVPRIRLHDAGTGRLPVQRSWNGRTDGFFAKISYLFRL